MRPNAGFLVELAEFGVAAVEAEPDAFHTEVIGGASLDSDEALKQSCASLRGENSNGGSRVVGRPRDLNVVQLIFIGEFGVTHFAIGNGVVSLVTKGALVIPFVQGDADGDFALDGARDAEIILCDNVSGLGIT